MQETERQMLAALAADDAEAFAALVEGGVSVDSLIYSRRGLPVIYVAVIDKSYNVASWLLTRRADIAAVNMDGETVINEIVSQVRDGVPGACDMAAKIIGAADPLLLNGYQGRAQPLHVLAQLGRTDLVRLMLERGAAVDRTDTDRMTALMYAAEAGMTDTVDLLIEKSADVNARNEDSEYVLERAIISVSPVNPGAEAAAIRLIEAGAHMQPKNHLGFSAPHMAAQYGASSLMRKMIEKGAMTDLADHRGMTPLLVAVNEGHVDVARLLLENGASVESADINGRTAAAIARKKGGRAMQALISHHENMLRQKKIDQIADVLSQGPSTDMTVKKASRLLRPKRK